MGRTIRDAAYDFLELKRQPFKLMVTRRPSETGCTYDVERDGELIAHFPVNAEHLDVAQKNRAVNYAHSLASVRQGSTVEVG